MPVSIGSGEYRESIYNAFEVKGRQEVDAIIKMDPRNKLGFGFTSDEVLHKFREERRNGTTHYVVKNGNQYPVALLSEDTSTKDSGVKLCYVRPNSKNWEKEALDAVEKFKDPEGYRLRKDLGHVVKFAEKTGLDPSVWRVPLEFKSEDSARREEELIEKFADEVILTTKGRLDDPKELASILKGYSSGKGAEPYWDKIADLCAQHMMAQMLSKQKLEGKMFTKKVQNWMDDKTYMALDAGDRLSDGLETNVLDKLGEGPQSLLKKLVDVFEAIGKALGKSANQIIDKLSQACGTLGATLGLDGQKIEEDVKDGLLSVKKEFVELGGKLKLALKNPATAGFGAAVSAAGIPIVEKLNQHGFNVLEHLAPGAGAAQIDALGVTAVTFVLSPLALGIRDWAVKKKEVEPNQIA
jgi:hypothetical protein